MDSHHIITVNNREIFEFYQKNNLDFEKMNILFMQILKSVLDNSDHTLSASTANRLLDDIGTICAKVSTLENNVMTILNIRLAENRKEYMNDVQLLLSNHNVEQITPLIRESNASLLDKTSVIINELVPRGNETLAKEMNSHFKVLQSSMMTETSKLLSSSLDKKTIEDFIHKTEQTLAQTHNTITTLMSQSETRFDSKLQTSERLINEMRTVVTEQNQSYKQLQSGVSEMLKKFEKGSGKGNISEQIIYNILLSLYPTAQIDYVGEQKETGDIILIRQNKPKILIENKDHESRNIPKAEIDKFIRDCEIQNCCGIMMAQHRGITNKNHFELQVNGRNVLLYLHEVNFDVDKIKTAIEIIEHFKTKLDEIVQTNDDYLIEKETLEEINKEFVAYTNQKYTLLKMTKDFTDKMTASITELKLPSLEKYLSTKFAFSTNQNDSICKYCNKFIVKSMMQHYRYCTEKREFESKNGVSEPQEDDPSAELTAELTAEPAAEPVPIPAKPRATPAKTSKKKNATLDNPQN
jgi:hypothetical protein